MEDLNVLLSDKFAEFSKKVTELAWEKKSKMQEFKALYEKFQAEMHALDQAVLDLQQDFENWKKERETNVGDG